MTHEGFERRLSVVVEQLYDLLVEPLGSGVRRRRAGRLRRRREFDLAVYRPGTGVWWILKSSTGYTAFASSQWGISTDTAINKRS